jgi:diguanylate cyclase (GGDEF)-like protein
MPRLRHSLQFKILTVFVISCVLILAAVFGVFSTLGKALLERHAYKEVVLSGETIVAELGNRTAFAQSLAMALANLGEALPKDAALTRQQAAHLLSHEHSEQFIAGGGLWPAPYAFDPGVERRSFFWGRLPDGTLQFYDEYNDPAGPGYHHEEWYVPATHLADGQAFWSRSYMDPYSYQPMVTVTVPMFRDGTFYGVSTVDLKLEGLHDFLADATRPFGGYAFAVDRNGKFLSFPDEQRTKVYGTDAQGQETQEFIHSFELAAEDARFRPLADVIGNAIERAVDQGSRLPAFDAALADAIAADSYQIEPQEARRIAAVLARTGLPVDNRPVEPFEVVIENDPVLGEAAYAAVFEMPQTSWKVVTVMPHSQAIAASQVIYKNLVAATLVAALVSIAIILLVVRRLLIRPLSDLSAQLHEVSAGERDEKLLTTRDAGELGQLVHAFNSRTARLLETRRELRQAHDALEDRVRSRTRELEEEIGKRREEQLMKEARTQRTEQQHAAIVRLSLDESLYQQDAVRAARTVTEIAADVLAVGRVSIWLLDEDESKVMRTVDLFDRARREHLENMVLDLKQYPSYLHALQTERSIAVEDIFAAPATAELTEYARALNIGALLDSPVRIGGQLRGVVCFEHFGGPRHWHEDEIRFAGEIADQFIQALTNAERLRSEDQVRQLAFYDPLTNLANRRLLQETLKHVLEVARRRGTFGSLLYLDLDNFKILNDSLGHAVGDQLLVQVAERLQQTLRSEDMAARLGGDEFVILLTAETHVRNEAIEQALNVARKVQDAIGRPYQLEGYEHVITTSIGITLYPDGLGSANDVLKQGDAAMYNAKNEGRNRIAFYSPELQAAARRRLTLEKELRGAIQDRSFELWYQTQMDESGRAVGAEALVRWRHAERGIVGPVEFIPAAEESGLILELGSWILEDACRFTRQTDLDHVAVNISPLQFRHPDFVAMVDETLRKTAADPKHLMIEITEGIVIQDIDDTVRKINALKDQGIRIAIDDFGTGYSSLAYLKRLPFDQLKIANEFVRDIGTDPNDAVIVETIISMARHLGLKVVAEGVETKSQLDYLVDKGCHLFQGYYFSKPVPAAELDTSSRGTGLDLA